MYVFLSKQQQRRQRHRYQRQGQMVSSLLLLFTTATTRIKPTLSSTSTSTISSTSTSLLSSFSTFSSSPSKKLAFVGTGTLSFSRTSSSSSSSTCANYNNPLFFPIKNYHNHNNHDPKFFPFVSSSRRYSSSTNKNNNDDDNDEISLLYPIDVLSQATNNNNNGDNKNSNNNSFINFDNRIELQQQWTLQEKGWLVQVEWKYIPKIDGIGLFAKQDIPKGQIIRRGIFGRNLYQFTSINDIESFCRINNSDDNTDTTSTSTSTSTTTICPSRINYVKDYLWGFYPDQYTNDKGYPILSNTTTTTKTTTNNTGNNNDNDDTRIFAMWIPGNGLNHDPSPNTVYRQSTSTGLSTRDNSIIDGGIDLIALKDIKMGEELYDDYRRHGLSPKWLLQFAKQYQVSSLNFADCNDFV